ncbi:MAG: conjugal transfer protein TraO [Pseudomonadota bacterium]
MSTFQVDVGRQFKIVVVAGTTLVIALGYIGYGYLNAPHAHVTEISPIQAGHGVSADESERYSEVLRNYNRANAASAISTGDTYLSAMSSRAEHVPPAPAHPAAYAPQQQAPSPAAAPAAFPVNSPAAPADPKQSERFGEQVLAFVGDWTPVMHATARLGEMPQQGKDTSKAGTAPTSLDELANANMSHKIVPAFTIAPAILGTDIDTDENSWVRASIPSGEFAGAILHAPGYRRLNNSVDVSFTFMEWRSHLYRVNAKGMDKDTMRTSLSGDVNNRYLARILVPALALGIGKAGQLFEQADTQTTVTPLGGVVQTRNGTPSGRAVSGTIVGGIATEAGRVLQADASQLPQKQVLIARQETIGIQFIDAVFTSDDVDLRAKATSTNQPAQAPFEDTSSPRQPRLPYQANPQPNRIAPDAIDRMQSN